VSSMGGSMSRLRSMGGSMSGLSSMGGSEVSSIGSSGPSSSPTLAQVHVTSSCADAGGGAHAGMSAGSSRPLEEEERSAAQAGPWALTRALHFPPPPPRPTPVAPAWSVLQPAPLPAEQGPGGQGRERMAPSLQAVMQLEEQAVALERSRNNSSNEGPRSARIQHTSFFSHRVYPSTAQATVPQLQAFSTATETMVPLSSDPASVVERENEEGERRGRAEGD